MKKKKPTLTHYSKRLKNVRLARTVTVIATLFVSGVVVAANVLPQVIKSNAATTSDTSNDVIAGGVDQWNGANAKSQLIQKVYNESSDQAQSAKALYAKFGVSQSDIQNATFEWLYGPNVTGTKVTPNESIVPFGNWNSFGRKNNSGYLPLEVTYGNKAANFYYKAHKIMFPNTWANGTSAEPVLMSKDRQWFIALQCGNIVVKTIPTNPTINFSKSVVRVNRAGKTVDHTASGFKLLINDQITYRLTGKNGNVTYPAGLRLADGIPTGTSFVSQGGDGWPNTTVTAVNPKPVVDGKTYVAWDFGAIPANQGGYTDMTVKVTSVSAQICNTGLWGKPGNLPQQTNQICLPVQQNKPLLTVTKVAQGAPTSVKLGDNVTYSIEMTNTGNAAATNALALDIIKVSAKGNPLQKFVSLGSPKITKIADGSTVTAITHAVKDAASQATYAAGNKYAFGYQVDSMPAGTKLSFTVTAQAILLPQSCDFAIGNYKDSGNAIAVSVTPDVCIPVIDNRKPHITVAKQAVSPKANTNVARGQTITYDVVVKNTSTAAAQNSEVVVKDTFTPPGYAKNIKVVGTSASFNNAGVTTQVVTDGVTIKIPKIPASGTVTVRISAVVADTAADNTKFCNNATITTNIEGSVPSETSSTVCHNVSLIKLSKTAKYVNRSDDPQKAAANAGDEIEYTLTTTNQATEIAKAYVVTEELADVLDYADVVDNGGGTLSGTKLIWPAKDIPAGGSITNTFIVKVKNPVPNNQASPNNPANFDYNMFNNYGNDVNIKINKPLVEQLVDVAENLPSTGAAQYGLLIFMIGLSVYFFVRNRQLTSELAAATVEYQHTESAASMTQAQNLIHPEADDVTPEPPASTPPAPPAA